MGATHLAAAECLSKLLDVFRIPLQGFLASGDPCILTVVTPSGPLCFSAAHGPILERESVTKKHLACPLPLARIQSHLRSHEIALTSTQRMTSPTHHPQNYSTRTHRTNIAKCIQIYTKTFLE